MTAGFQEMVQRYLAQFEKEDQISDRQRQTRDALTEIARQVETLSAIHPDQSVHLWEHTQSIFDWLRNK